MIDDRIKRLEKNLKEIERLQEEVTSDVDGLHDDLRQGKFPGLPPAGQQMNPMEMIPPGGCRLYFTIMAIALTALALAIFAIWYQLS